MSNYALAMGRAHDWFTGQETEVKRAMAGMRQPWLDSKNLLPSLGGFAELQGIGLALRKLPPFSDVLAEQLRVGLGDWQAPLGPLPGTLLDPLARTDFYRSH